MSERLHILQRRFDVLEEIRRVPDLAGLYALLGSIARDHGFETFCLTGVPDPGRKLDGYMLMAGWPDEWFERYHAEDYIQHDPVVARLRESDVPFVWSDASAGTAGAMARQVMGEAAEFGMQDGFCVPVYSPRGFQAAFSLGGREAALSEAERAVLHLVGIYAHTRVTELAGSPHWEERPRLTPREVECLRWTAAGKTSWEVSCILSIRETTVVTHLQAVARKLDARNRTHAVAIGFRHGLIS